MGTILVTGANRGIGLELACQYVEAGDYVIATCREPEAANALLHLKQSHQGVDIAALDVTDPVSIASLVSLLKERRVSIDLLINNAGVLYPEPVGEWGCETFTRTLRTNVVGPAMVMQSFASLLAKGAKVVNISSGLGSFGMGIDFGGPTGTYAASKAGLNMVVAQMAPRFREKGITVVAFNPGWVKTDMGGQEAALDVEESVSSLRASFEKLTLEDSGRFIDYNGEPLPW
ncbi:SDR family oxidoreductase [Pelagicoccus sp. SDUM812003]|uniref:SDR family oxidoreductase n=1 Tax=Pelagicoccus sp. SDUM812003 TaxID=3041267 RepID=UPI00280E929F|nr:SDR family oxidoreductase [Pelagicoccus sp. SDUM812003]MDQ8203240.1 SDR family oxidoreductase [Pelagicoccus sp. SDUM812003]